MLFSVKSHDRIRANFLLTKESSELRILASTFKIIAYVLSGQSGISRTYFSFRNKTKKGGAHFAVFVRLKRGRVQLALRIEIEA